MSEYFVKLRSNYLNGTIDLSIIMPNPLLAFDPEKFYNSKEKFPVIWLFHGGSETYADWITYTAVARQAIYKNAIILAPTLPNSDFINQPLVGEGYPFYDFFYHELMPFVYNWFPASDDPQKNFLVGDSMGAEAAWRYGLLKPDSFGCIAPIGKRPCDYSYLEAYRQMSTVEFVRMAKSNGILAAYGPGGSLLHNREINNIRKYDTVGDFLDSIENTMARFDEAAKKGALPKVYLAGEKTNVNLKAFEQHVGQIGAKGITFEWVDPQADVMDFNELAFEMFLNFVGLENIEDPKKGKPPHMPGVHDFPEGTPGRTMH